MPQHIITDKAFHAIAHGPDRHAQTHGRRKVSLQFTRPGKNPFQIKKYFFSFLQKNENFNYNPASRPYPGRTIRR
jgi:hypothetical protein